MITEKYVKITILQLYLEDVEINEIYNWYEGKYSITDILECVKMTLKELADTNSIT